MFHHFLGEGKKDKTNPGFASAKGQPDSFALRQITDRRVL